MMLCCLPREDEEEETTKKILFAECQLWGRAMFLRIGRMTPFWLIGPPHYA
jgi:hypothetical protein